MDILNKGSEKFFFAELILTNALLFPVHRLVVMWAKIYPTQPLKTRQNTCTETIKDEDEDTGI